MYRVKNVTFSVNKFVTSASGVRGVLSQPHCVGGLEMLNLEMYIKDLKLGLEEFLKAVHKLLSYCLAQRILILQILNI